MKTAYHIVDSKDSRGLARFLSREGQAPLPMFELIEQAEVGVDQLIDMAGPATIEAGLTLSAQELAGPEHHGKRTDGNRNIGWHGEQPGVVIGGACGRSGRAVGDVRVAGRERGAGTSRTVSCYGAIGSQLC